MNNEIRRTASHNDTKDERPLGIGVEVLFRVDDDTLEVGTIAAEVLDVVNYDEPTEIFRVNDGAGESVGWFTADELTRHNRPTTVVETVAEVVEVLDAATEDDDDDRLDDMPVNPDDPCDDRCPTCYPEPEPDGVDDPKTVSRESMSGEPVDDNDPIHTFAAMAASDEMFLTGGKSAPTEDERKALDAGLSMLGDALRGSRTPLRIDDVETCDAAFDALERGDEIFVRFTDRGIQKARVSRIGEGRDASRRVYVKKFRVSTNDWSGDLRIRSGDLINPDDPRIPAKLEEIERLTSAR